jgi:hypothetical protein
MFVTANSGVLFAVRNEFLNFLKTSFCFKELTTLSQQQMPYHTLDMKNNPEWNTGNKPSCRNLIYYRNSSQVVLRKITISLIEIVDSRTRFEHGTSEYEAGVLSTQQRHSIEKV